MTFHSMHAEAEFAGKFIFIAVAAFHRRRFLKTQSAKTAACSVEALFSSPVLGG